jgi:cytochrome c biogenesis protein CcmG, thiol:disulfide interchange protein DsbE
MKQLFITALLATTLSAVFAQEKRTLPSVELQTLDGKKVNLNSLTNNGKPIYISFWALWCTNCIKELNVITDLYADWQKETGVKIVAISIDDERNKSKVGPFVNGRNWEYEVLLDPNSDAKRALNVNTIPHSFLLNGKGEIIHQHNGYNAGDEDELYKMIQKLAAGDSTVVAPKK